MTQSTLVMTILASRDNEKVFLLPQQNYRVVYCLDIVQKKIISVSKRDQNSDELIELFAYSRLYPFSIIGIVFVLRDKLQVNSSMYYQTIP